MMAHVLTRHLPFHIYRPSRPAEEAPAAMEDMEVVTMATETTPTQPSRLATLQEDLVSDRIYLDSGLDPRS